MNKNETVLNVHEDNKKDTIIIDKKDIHKLTESIEKPKEEVNKKSTAHLYPKTLTEIFKTLGMHSQTGIRPPNSAKHRAKMNKIHKTTTLMKRSTRGR
jgi:hypothetical protein